MSLHIHPIFRAKEEAYKAAGMLVTLDSQAFQLVQDLELAGGTFRESPKVTYKFCNTQFTPPQIPVGS